MAVLPAPRVRDQDVIMFGQFHDREAVRTACEAMDLLSVVPLEGNGDLLKVAAARLGMMDLTADEIASLANGCSWNVTGTTLVVRTARDGIQAASKVLLTTGAKIELYSSERFPHALW